MNQRTVVMLMSAVLAACASQPGSLDPATSMYISNVRAVTGSTGGARRALMNSLVMRGGYTEVISEHTSRITEQGYGTPLMTSDPIGEVPFRQALALVIPADWKAYVNGAIRTDTPVSWAQGEAFPATVESIVRGVEASAIVDWDLQIVRVDPIDARPPRTRLGDRARHNDQVTSPPAPLLVHPDDFNAQPVRINRANATLDDIIHDLVPADYEVQIDVPKAVQEQRWDALVETSRGRAVHDLAEQFGVRILPYHRHRLVVVTTVEP